MQRRLRKSGRSGHLPPGEERSRPSYQAPYARLEPAEHDISIQVARLLSGQSSDQRVLGEVFSYVAVAGDNRVDLRIPDPQIQAAFADSDLATLIHAFKPQGYTVRGVISTHSTDQTIAFDDPRQYAIGVREAQCHLSEAHLIVEAA